MQCSRKSILMERAERFLIRLVIVSALVLIMIQALVVNNPFLKPIDGVGLDHNTAVSTSTIKWDQPHITLYLENYSSLPHLKVLVNGDQVAVFDDRYTTVTVQEGDVIQIDGTFYNHNILVKVLNTTAEVFNPAVEKQIIVKGNVVEVGPVKIKDNK
ncbi:MAG: hypothetical protein H0Z40_10355 [Desulfotomaculum sp.]|nr:hypothetical protein [Desulfotomaculum sp.]